MFVEAIKKVNKAMFPIFRAEPVSETQSSYAVAGTGFFVSENGHFVSTAHCFANKTEKTKFVFYGYLPDSLNEKPCEIVEFTSDITNDLFIGKVDILTPDYIQLADSMADVGRTVCIAGYPLAAISVNTSGGLELGGVRRYFQPSFVLDHTTLTTDVFGTRVLHDGFLVRDSGLFGMSGGPVFDINGLVMGVQGSVTTPRASTSGNRTISVENAMVIKSSLFINLFNSGAQS